jgi:photosystem II stability/assembly factor-like uncharacterized protein
MKSNGMKKCLIIMREYAIIFLNTGWAVGSWGVIAYTDDSGYNWTHQDVSNDYDLYGVDFVDADNGWAVGSGGVIFRASNGGWEWIIQFNPGQPACLYDVVHCQINYDRL